MYEQDYIMRVNRDVIRTMAKLLLNKDIDSPEVSFSDELKSEEKRSLESVNGQTDMGNLHALEQEIWKLMEEGQERALEKALLFYSYLNEQNEEYLASQDFNREDIKTGLMQIASKYGVDSVVGLMYF